MSETAEAAMTSLRLLQPGERLSAQSLAVGSAHRPVGAVGHRMTAAADIDPSWDGRWRRGPPGTCPPTFLPPKSRSSQQERRGGNAPACPPVTILETCEHQQMKEGLVIYHRVTWCNFVLMEV